MREILFCGKRKDNGEWVEGYLVEDTIFYGKPDHHTYIVNHEHPSGCFGADIYIEVDPDTVCEYTGLNDKNGKRIFEGSIVRYIYEPGKGYWNANQLSVVKWDKTGFTMDGIMGTNKYACMSGQLCTIPFDQDAKNIPEFEVVGNIHDNRDLLGGQHG